MENFYANHRNFVKSRNYKQLRGNGLGAESLTSCDPIIKMYDIGNLSSLDPSNPLKKDDVAFPCGLIGKYFFKDTYKLYNNKTST